jgi:hypothetical protein
VGLSGFLYVAIVVGWAVYLVPFALKRYDEAARNRSIDRFSSAMRVLGRREDGLEGDRPQDAEAQPRHVPVPAQQPVIDPRAEHRAARTAARRRRRVLLLLVLATTGTAVAAWFLLVPRWSVAVPASLLLVWMLVCPLQARRERRAASDRPARSARLRRSAPVPAHAGAEQARAEEPRTGSARVGIDHSDDDMTAGEAATPQVASDQEPTVVLDAPERPDDADTGSGSLWDPVPVTLPTYVHKPRAPRTIRTIDLGSVGVQSSGRTSDTQGSGGTGDAPDERTTGDAQSASARAVGE